MTHKSNPETSTQLFELNKINNTRIQVSFDEPELSSDGGVLLLKEAIDTNGIINDISSAIVDDRNPAYVKHSVTELLTQRILQICHGYEDTNDCNFLKNDPALKVAAGITAKDSPLASQPTMTRFENSISLKELLRIFYKFIDNFLNSYTNEPECMIIDMDPTPNRVYGDQQLALFNAHYDEYCLMPFHVYEGITGRLISTVIRPGKTPTREEILAILKRIVKRIRNRFSNTKIIFRADSHHTKPAVMDWLEENAISYITGMSTNSILKQYVESKVEFAQRKSKELFGKYRCFHTFYYKAQSWSKPRRIVARIEASTAGTDVRFIVTDLSNVKSKFLYEKLYCDRANAELMIKEHKCFLKSSRTSCTTAIANQFRLFLHSAAYVVMHSLRDTLLSGTDLANATFETIRLRVLKVAARIERAKTYIRLHMPISSQSCSVFEKLVRLNSAMRQQ